MMSYSRILVILTVFAPNILRIFSQRNSSVTELKENVGEECFGDTERVLLDDYFYVDKTKYALNLIDSGIRSFFLARPRGFGKSTFLRTLQAIFEGRKHIFKGTYIYDYGYDWETYSVLYFDFSATDQLPVDIKPPSNNMATPFYAALLVRIAQYRHIYNINTPSTNLHSIGEQFYNLLRGVSENRDLSVVVLIDEYDYPILGSTLSYPEVVKSNKEILSAIFTTLKENSRYIKFSFITGRTKCSFPDVGQRMADFFDITNLPAHEGIAGITAEELNSTYRDHIKFVSERRNLTAEEVKKELEYWYDGYTFSMLKKNFTTLYNAHSLTHYFRKTIPGYYWPQKEQAEFLYKILKKNPVVYTSAIWTDELGGEYVNLEQLPFPDLMYETGYFTVKDVNITGFKFLLDFANEEVKRAFTDHLIEAGYARDERIKNAVEIASNAINRVDPDFDNFMRAVDSIFISLPFKYCREAGSEAFYRRNIFWILSHCQTRNPELEYVTSTGVVDIIGETLAKIIFVFELKFNRSEITEAYDRAAKSVPEFLNREQNILVAGLTFAPVFEPEPATVLKGWMAKLIAPDGTEIKEYRYQYDGKAKPSPKKGKSPRGRPPGKKADP